MEFFKNLFGSKKRHEKANSASDPLDEAIRLNEDYEYPSNETKSFINSGLLTIQKIDQAEQALKNRDLKLAVSLFEEAASLTPKEEDKIEYMKQADNLRCFI